MWLHVKYVVSDNSMAGVIDVGLCIILKNTSLKIFQIATSNIINYGQCMIINDLL